MEHKPNHIEFLTPSLEIKGLEDIVDIFSKPIDLTAHVTPSDTFSTLTTTCEFSANTKLILEEVANFGALKPK